MQPAPKIDWHQYFLNIAHLASLRSEDIYTRVGSVCVSKDRRILSTGYNGLVAGFETPKDFYVDRENPLRKLLTIHSEENALSRCPQSQCDSIYITCSPCDICAKSLVNAGVRSVYFAKLYHRESNFAKIFDFYGINYKHIELSLIS